MLNSKQIHLQQPRKKQILTQVTKNCTHKDGDDDDDDDGDDYDDDDDEEEEEEWINL